MLAEITKLDDWHEELSELLPIKIRLLRPLSAPDGSDYALSELFTPITRGKSKITHIIIGGRFAGSRVGRSMKDFPINIALVIGNSLLNDQQLDFKKGEYVAIGFVSEVEA